MAFQPIPLADIMAAVKSVHNEPGTKTSAEPCPTFGPHPNTSAADFDFQQEVECLPFKLNLGDVPLEKEHQARFIDLIYSNQEVFSLHDEDLGYCNKLTHTLPTSTDKSVYLPHRTIPRQLQGEVCKCLNTWLHQGIIQPSNSPYASQVVLVQKKTGEICICVDYRKLNSITIRDAFPLPHIDEALQAVHKIVMSSLPLTWHKDTYSWPWQKMTLRRPHLQQVLQAYMSLLTCLLACPMLDQASAG